MTNDDERGEGGKKYQKFDDVICERPLTLDIQFHYKLSIMPKLLAGHIFALLWKSTANGHVHDSFQEKIWKLRPLPTYYLKSVRIFLKSFC